LTDEKSKDVIKQFLKIDSLKNDESFAFTLVDA
jgi:hypothetical protein